MEIAGNATWPKKVEAMSAYKKEIQIFWWTKKWSHLKFILRELTSLVVMATCLEILLLTYALLYEPDASYWRIIEYLSHPLAIVFNIFVLGGLIFHSATWFNLAPKAMEIKIGKTRIPGFVIVGSNYGAWIVISALIFWILSM